VSNELNVECRSCPAPNTQKSGVERTQRGMLLLSGDHANRQGRQQCIHQKIRRRTNSTWNVAAFRRSCQSARKTTMHSRVADRATLETNLHVRSCSTMHTRAELATSVADQRNRRCCPTNRRNLSQIRQIRISIRPKQSSDQKMTEICRKS